MKKDYFETLGWFFAPQYWWLRHLLFWFYRYSDLLLGKVGILSDMEVTLKDFLLLHFIPDLVFVYLNLLVLMPQLLLKRKIWTYLFTALVTLLLYSGYTYSYAPVDPEETLTPLTQFFSYDLLDGVQLFVVVLGLRLMLEFNYQQRRLAELQNTNLQTELAYLKSQVSPHFLFNMLNSIAVLSEKYPDKVTPVILKLSNVLRYQLYEGEKEQVALTDEIENLRAYLALEALRQNKMEVNFQVHGNTNGLLLPPLLFLPFIENAVKHGINAKGESRIDIRFEVQPDSLHFFVENAKPPQPSTHLAGGLGLKNIRRRLELLFPNSYQLTEENLTDKFIINLYLTFP
jgi:two-component system, LytTR family, sensor kinase